MVYSIKKTRKSRLSAIKNPRILVPLLLILVVAVLLVLELTNTTYLFHKKVAVSSTIPATTNETSASNDTDKSSSQGSATSTNNSTQNNEKIVSTPSSGSDLLAPSGSFASSHRPSLKNSPGMESICITTPGATCTIIFTLDNAVKTLDSKKTDDTGAVVWNWNLNEAGFIPGSWQITATASLNGQSKSTTDIQKLEVQP